MLSVDVEKLYPAAKTLVKARAASRIHAKDATLYDFSPEAQACASDYMGWADLATSPLCDMDAIQALPTKWWKRVSIRFCLSVRAAPLRRP